MIVVADTSPLIVLINLGHVEILPRLFGQVVPPEVMEELRHERGAASVRDLACSPPSWLVERAPRHGGVIERLDKGESAAINLALELGADLLLIEEALGRKAAIERRVVIAGTIGVLEMGAHAGLLDLADAFERLLRTDFWITKEFLDARLAAFRRERSQS
jgi:predicted nucleic acid-binding protein